MSDEPQDVLAHLTVQRLADDLPVSLMVYNTAGMLVAMNRRAEEFWQIQRAGILGRFNILEDQQSVAQGSAALFQRALIGERINTDPVPYDTSKANIDQRDLAEDWRRYGIRKLWIRATIFPLHDAQGAVCNVVLMHEDVSAQMEQTVEMAEALDQISRQRAEIETLSSPIIRVWDGIITVPLVGAIDGRRAMNVTERLLEAIVEHQADIVILDITGVPLVDTSVASALMQAARAVHLLGSQVVLVGLTAEVARTLITLGSDLSQIRTLANLQAGLAWAFAQQGLVVGAVLPRAA